MLPHHPRGACLGSKGASHLGLSFVAAHGCCPHVLTYGSELNIYLPLMKVRRLFLFVCEVVISQIRVSPPGSWYHWEVLDE
jgi:hypothetical protein